MLRRLIGERAQRLLGNHRGDQFRARSAVRDADTDRTRISAVFAALDGALRAAEDEHSGLGSRVSDVLARAAVTVGTGTDEYLDREEYRSHYQDLFDAEITNGERRLKELSTTIGHLKFLRAVLLSRFPDMK